jgi:hypothetical protein
MLPLGKCLKLTLASGATALGSAWPAALIYQTDPLPVGLPPLVPLDFNLIIKKNCIFGRPYTYV